jgi:hypothetical protein
MTQFQAVLAEKLRARKRRGVRERRLLKFLEGPDGERKRRILARMESHARVQLGMSASEPGKWAERDWDKFFEALLKFLLALLPFLLV